MAQKNATPSKSQKAMIKAAGYNPLCWVIHKELINYIIIRHRTSGEIKTIKK